MRESFSIPKDTLILYWRPWQTRLQGRVKLTSQNLFLMRCDNTTDNIFFHAGWCFQVLERDKLKVNHNKPRTVMETLDQLKEVQAKREDK